MSAEPYTSEEVARKAWIREWQSGSDDARFLATLDARDAEIAKKDAEIARLTKRVEEAERLLRVAAPCLRQLDTPCDGVRWHHAREIDAFLRPAPSTPAKPATGEGG